MPTAGSQLTSGLVNTAGFLVLSLVASMTIYFNWGGSPGLPVMVLCISLPLIFLVFVNSENRLLMVSLFWVEAISISTLYGLVDTSIIAIFGIVWVVQAASLFDRKIATRLLLGSILVFTLSQLFHHGLANIVQALVNVALFGLFQVFAFGALQLAKGERGLREEAGALNRELIATRELLSQTAAQAERLRIARDLHDILGHHMTALILNLEVAKHGAEGKTQEKVEQSLALAKLLLGDIRTAVGELRQDDVIDLKQSIGKLTEGIPHLNITTDFSNAPPITRVELAETLLRCAQEAITNVIRHSRASQCEITLSRNEDGCRLVILDNGVARKNIQVGNGIQGMTERVKGLGGSLSWAATAHGFQVTAQLPMDADS